ncbi:phosphoadenylyl-sulfate reductase [Yoonia sediminilitoris]|uniref:Adenosine 5'-phosphosulfate reductase n=1 Tax=Yoonia sediminilitoris TaxID=1286148 RepID=A0A2T6KRB4_9RHOB|nr:phosphoadenylyl-sulfate reductase [Yoonia sediminilitoris]PUB19096.1 phosphoadenylylsulfate reductase (thioredoxin) [Yoonia sediminilitoris]RCW99264.1 phosphoadenylylsulfate reductase (thioredoxin) [Yoonia sediminilitoris]
MPLKELAERRNMLHRKSDAQTIVKHALDDVQIGKVALVSSFGAEAVVLLHMVAQVGKATPVIFLDTEMLFPETLAYQREVSGLLGLTDVRIIGPDRNDVLTHDVDGLLHQADTDACCDLRKTRPLNRALGEFDGWITGRKRYQGGQRAQLPLYEKEDRKIKINPLANWSAQDVQDYMGAHDLPRHPLVADGYPSVGCMPCTTRANVLEDPRAGRWRNAEKTECGIHNRPRKEHAA